MSAIELSESQATTPSTEMSSSQLSSESSSTTSLANSNHASEVKAKKGPYTQDQALDDLPEIRVILSTFLSSAMVEAETMCREGDLAGERMYFTAGSGLIQALKGLLSFEDKDLLGAIQTVKHAILVASQHRKPTSLAGRLASFVVGGGGTSFYKSMTPVERHAELVYAECLLEKAILGIVYSGDWLAFVSEALSLRSAMGIFRHLSDYIEEIDREATERGEGPIDKSVDQDFRTGVLLGTGVNSLVLSLLPGKIITIVEMFGYKGDRHEALATLCKAGQWTKESDTPGIDAKEEGLRRPIIDMALLIFHLVLGSFTHDGVDISMAKKILDFNLTRFPNGIFFLFGEGRLRVCQSQPHLAVESYKKAINVQSEYIQLQHISLWEQSICYLSLYELELSSECWRRLQAEANWSKAVYTYGLAACLAQIGGEKNTEEAKQMMGKVEGLKQRIAGKSIPLEKFASRKARKFKDQGGWLLLPALELAHIFLAIAHAPRSIILKKHLPTIQVALDELALGPAKYTRKKSSYWDDLCLARFLQGVCLRFVAYPDKDAVLDPEEVVTHSTEDVTKQAFAALKQVIENGPKIQLDHYLVYQAHYELGRLEACVGNKEEAKRHLELVLSGKPLEVNAAGRKGKYSMQNGLVLRAHAALETLEKGQVL